MRSRAFAMLVGVLILFSAMVTTVHAASMSVRADKQSGCVWHVTIEIAGMKPGSEVFLDMNASNTRDCGGNATNPSWSNWSQGPADSNGRLTTIFIHGDYGRYDFTARDSHGNRATASLQYGYDQPQPTLMPTSVPPPTQEPVIIHPTPAVTNPQAWSRIDYFGNCRWNVTIEIAGFAPHSDVWLTLNSSSARNCIGNTTNPSWSDWHQGQTDSAGRKTMILEHGDYGRYDFSVRDGAGNRAQLRVEYTYSGGSSSQPQPTQRPGGNSGAEPTYPPPPTWIPPQQPGNSGCNSLSRLSIGDTASVSDATPDPVPMRTGPATSYSIIMQVAVREHVVITGGPSCPENLVWWEVRKDGRTGWMAEINRFNNRNLLLVESGGEIDSQQQRFQSVVVTFPGSAERYTLSVNLRTCAIANGSTIIREELARFSGWVHSATLSDIREYFAVNSGTVEMLRHTIEHEVSNQTICSRTYYLVGTHAMDTSGLGNVVFGYFSHVYPKILEDAIAHVAQGLNENSRGWFWDFPDDTSQRRLGRTLGDVRRSGAALTESIIERAAEAVDLF